MQVQCWRWSKCRHHSVKQPLIVSKPVASFFRIISIAPCPALTLGKFKAARRASHFILRRLPLLIAVHCTMDWTLWVKTVFRKALLGYHKEWLGAAGFGAAQGKKKKKNHKIIVSMNNSHMPSTFNVEETVFMTLATKRELWQQVWWLACREQSHGARHRLNWALSLCSSAAAAHGTEMRT